MTLNHKSRTRSETMRCKAILSFLLLLICQNLFSQFYWQKTYNSYIGGDDEAYDGCAADGSNFYVVGYTGIFDYYMYVAKFNQLGDTLWTRTFLGGVANAVAPSDDGGCVLTGRRNNCFSMKLDLNGNIVWDKTYPNGTETGDITKTGDSGYVMCGGLFSGYICKIDTLGNLEWEKYYNDLPQSFTKMEPAIGGGYLVCGRKFISNNWHAYLMKIDALGNMIWEKAYDGRYILSFEQYENRLILAGGFNISGYGRTILTKTNSEGLMIREDTIQINSQTDLYQSTLMINNILYVSFTSQIPSNYGYVGKILKMDTNFNVIKDVTLNHDSSSIFSYSLIEAPGSNINDIICFGSFEPIGFEDVDLYVARLDSSLTQPPPISVNLISSLVPQKSELSQNYPNPFNPNTTITFSLVKSGVVKIKIFDITGKVIEVKTSKFYNAGNHKFDFIANNLSSGIYFYQLTIDGIIVDTKKMCLLK